MMTTATMLLMLVVYWRRFTAALSCFLKYSARFSAKPTLSDQLQATSLDLAAAVALIQVVAIRLTELRTEVEFEKLWNSVSQLTETCSIHLPEMRKKRPRLVSTRLQDTVVMETTGQRGHKWKERFQNASLLSNSRLNHC